MPILHNDGSSHTHARSPTSQNQRILVLNRPIANLLLGRKRLPSFPFRILLFVKQVLSGAFPNVVIDVNDGPERDTENPSLSEEKENDDLPGRHLVFQTAPLSLNSIAWSYNAESR
jgi:hypothetical protein